MAEPLFDLGLSAGALQALGLLAGAFVASSSLPAVFDSIANPKSDSWYQVCRNSAAAFGNAAWVLFGVQAGHTPIVGFCSLSAALLIYLTFVQSNRLLKGEHKNAHYTQR